MKKNRLAKGVIGAALMAVAITPTAVLANNNDIQVKVDNVSVQFPDAKPFIDKSTSRTMVPVRFVSEKLGATVDWDGTQQTVTMNKDGKEIVLKIGEKKATVGGQPITFDAAAALQNNRTFVPLRFVSEAYDAKVDWVASDRLVLISTQKNGAVTPGNETPVVNQPGTPSQGSNTPTTPSDGNTSQKPGEVGSKVGAEGQFVVVPPSDPDFLTPKDPVTEPAMDAFVASLKYENGEINGKIPKLPEGHLMTLTYRDMKDQNLYQDLTGRKAGEFFEFRVSNNGGQVTFVIYEGNVGKNAVYVKIPQMEVEWGTKR